MGRNFSLLAVSSGTLGLLVALAVVVQVLVASGSEPLQIALLSLMFFALATAFLTALGIRFWIGRLLLAVPDI